MHRFAALFPVLLLAAACGRLRFDPSSDGDGGSIGDSGPPPSGWWDPSWHRRIKLSLGDPGGAPLANVPLLVHLDTSRIDYGDTAASGADVRFVDADNTTVLAYEIEKWSPSSDSYLWVRVPQVDVGASGDYIWLYYDNPAAAAAPNPAALWSEYALAWHVDENPAAAAPQIHDSSANTNNGTAAGAMPAAAQTTGEIAGSLAFDGVDDWIAGPSATSLQLTGDVTISVWALRQTGARREWLCDITTPQSESAGNNHLYEVTFETTNEVVFEWEYNGGSDEATQSTQPITTGLSQWVMITVTRNVATNEARFYENGNPLGLPVAYTNDPTGGNTGSFWFGGMPDSSSTKSPFSGRLDEIRIEGRVRPAAWIATQYRSMIDTFLGYGAPESY